MIGLKQCWKLCKIKIDKKSTIIYNLHNTGVTVEAFVIDITQDLPFLNIHNLFTNERISVYFDKHSRIVVDTKDYFVKQINHLSMGLVIVASA